jgi:hypothetical protein
MKIVDIGWTTPWTKDCVQSWSTGGPLDVNQYLRVVFPSPQILSGNVLNIALNFRHELAYWLDLYRSLNQIMVLYLIRFIDPRTTQQSCTSNSYISSLSTHTSISVLSYIHLNKFTDLIWSDLIFLLLFSHIKAQQQQSHKTNKNRQQQQLRKKGMKGRRKRKDYNTIRNTHTHTFV